MRRTAEERLFEGRVKHDEIMAGFRPLWSFSLKRFFFDVPPRGDGRKTAAPTLL